MDLKALAAAASTTTDLRSLRGICKSIAVHPDATERVREQMVAAMMTIDLRLGENVLELQPARAPNAPQAPRIPDSPVPRGFVPHVVQTIDGGRARSEKIFVSPEVDLLIQKQQLFARRR